MPHYNNLELLFYSCPARALLEGDGWYREAHDFAEYLTVLYGITIEQACGVLAVISPQMKWEQNITAAQTIIEAWHSGKQLYDIIIPGYPDNHKKAWQILVNPGEPVESFLGKRAPKVRAFYDNILYPKTSQKVTVDSWMVRAYYDDATLDGKVKSAKEYRAIADSIVALAVKHGYSPLRMQAILWCEYRRRQIHFTGEELMVEGS